MVPVCLAHWWTFQNKYRLVCRCTILPAQCWTNFCSITNSNRMWTIWFEDQPIVLHVPRRGATCVGLDICEKHEYYLELHVHIHITSKNGDARKLWSEKCHGTHFPPDDPSYDVIDQMPEGRVLNFLGGLKDGRKAIEMLVTFDR